MADYTKTITISDIMVERIAKMTDEAKRLAPAVRQLAIETWRVVDDFEDQLAPQVDEWSSGEAERIREATGFAEMWQAVSSLACDLDNAIGGSPTGPPDWLVDIKREMEEGLVRA
jgi:hypothetical protein